MNYFWRVWDYLKNLVAHRSPPLQPAAEPHFAAPEPPSELEDKIAAEALEHLIIHGDPTKPVGGLLPEPMPVTYSASDATPSPVEAKTNRQQRRRLSALERARRKHDVFVEPKGTPPTPHVREKTETEEKQPISAAEQKEIDDAEIFFHEKHHRDLNGPDVLYRESEMYGEYNFRDTILEQLERYFVYLKRMKKSDPDAYGLYKEIGAQIVPYVGSGSDYAARNKEKLHTETFKPHIELPPFFNKHRPSFGCFVFGADPEVEAYELRQTEIMREQKGHEHARNFVPKFMYFTKYKLPPPEIQPMTGGDTYRMTITWDRPHDPDKKFANHDPVSQEYAIFISADGSRLEILRMCKFKHVEVLVKKKRRDARGNIDFYHQIPQRLWQIPHQYGDWAKDHGTNNTQSFLADIFCSCVKRLEYANYSMVRIAATKDNLTAVFGVNIHRMAYFFQDRDYVLNESGRRKPIFHIVRAHERHTKDGKTYYMPFGFRGEREFKWADYDITITVPARDHFMLPDLDIGVEDSFWRKRGQKMMDGAQIGKYLADKMKQGTGGYG